MKKLADLKQGGYFFYGGVQWVVLENDEKIGATLAIAAEPVFNRAFDEENRNDWRVSSLRRELNGPFFDALVAEGANRAAFLDWESDLTADNGMTDYGTATDKIALLSDGLYRKYRQFIPLVDDWCWTLTPWTCNPSYSCSVRYVLSSGGLDGISACNGYGGARPLCYLESSIFVSVPYEEETADPRADMIEEASDAVLETLGGYPADIWGEANQYMFPSPVTEEMYHPDSVVKLHEKILKDANLEHIRFHDLRHTFATLALQNGVDVKTVSSMLGHYDAGFTLRTYTHATRQQQNRAAETMGNFMAQVM